MSRRRYNTYRSVQQLRLLHDSINSVFALISKAGKAGRHAKTLPVILNQQLDTAAGKIQRYSGIGSPGMLDNIFEYLLNYTVNDNFVFRWKLIFHAADYNLNLYTALMRNPVYVPPQYRQQSHIIEYAGS